MKSPLLWLKSAALSGADWLQRHGFYRLANRWGRPGSSYSGESVSQDSALGHSVVWACRRVICEAVGQAVPLNMMQEVGSEKRHASDKPMYTALRDMPNEEMTAGTFRETLTGHVLMSGSGYALIIRRSGTEEARELYPLVPEAVRQDREKSGKRRLVYIVKDGNSTEKTYTVIPGEPHDILHIPGITHNGVDGLSVLEYARNSIGNANAVERYAGKFFANGGRQPGYIEVASPFKNPEQAQKMREDVDKFTSNPDNTHRWAIFEPGQTFKASAFSPADSQFLETRQWTPAEICRWFGVPPHMVGDLSRATFTNIEHQDLEFVKRVVMAHFKRWEQNLYRCVLTPKERKQGYFFRHNVNALVRGDFPTRMAGYSTALQNGFMSQNEVRDLEDMNRFEGGDDYHIQLNMQTLPGGSPTTSQQAALTKIGTAKKKSYGGAYAA